MAEHIVPRRLFEIANAAENEAGKLEVVIDLIQQSLEFSHDAPEEASRAQGQLFVLTELLEAMQGRLNALAEDAYDLRAGMASTT